MMNFINAIKMMKDPKKAVLEMVNNNNNPILKNAFEKAKNNDKQGVEQIARNLMKEQGRDFDSEFKSFMNNFK